MSDFHPVRQAAEADFLDALDHLDNTFGGLEGEAQSASSPSDFPAALTFEDLELEDLELDTSGPVIVTPVPVPPPGAIAEGYDKQAVRNPEALGGKD